MGMKIGYYLKLKHEPKHNTLSWTLDYRYSSDVGKYPPPYFISVLTSDATNCIIAP